MAAYEVTVGSQEGHETRVLVAHGSDLQAAFAPRVGMVGCSLRWRGEELLGQRGGLRKYAETGSSFGIPLLAPWANRLAALEYATAGRMVRLDPDAVPVRLDPGGLPIHGLLAASPHWEVTAEEAGDHHARLNARLDFAARPELMAGFPFAHELAVEVTLSGHTLSIETTMRATGSDPVPVAFGYHPYLVLPDTPRVEWEVTLPVRRRALLDERGIPTGCSEPVRFASEPLGERAFDDLFVELCHPPEFAAAAGQRRVEVRFEQGYPVAQVYAPADQDFVCFEPMTAPTNALVSHDGLRFVEPGGVYVASFSIWVGEA